jgi:trimeric autotransporter adhesin
VFAAAGGADSFPLSLQQTSALIEAACSSSSKKRRSSEVSAHWQHLLAMFARADAVQSGRQHGLALRHCATEQLLPEGVAVALQAAQLRLRIHNRAAYFIVDKVTRLCWPTSSNNSRISSSSSSSNSSASSLLDSTAAAGVDAPATAGAAALADAAVTASSDAAVAVPTVADVSTDMASTELQQQHQYWLLGLLALLRTVRIAAAAAQAEALAAVQQAAAGAAHTHAHSDSAAAAAARQAAREPVESARALHHSVIRAAQAAGDHHFPVQLFEDMLADGVCPS